MQGKKLFIGLKAALGILAVAMFAGAGGAWASAQETVLYDFSDSGTDGYSPDASLIFDGAGNLYGTTYYGGTYGYGTVYELTPIAGGGWKEKVLYNFNDDGMDGVYPNAGLIFDASGNLYGTTAWGGAYGFNDGTVFELTPTAGGDWTETVLHSFGKGKDGNTPDTSLIFDASSNLYGTTYSGGRGNCNGGCGVVWKLTPAAGGWTERILHNFSGKQGRAPHSGLVFDATGNLYGTTYYGGTHAIGMVFELKHKADGSWWEKNLYSFNGKGGQGPFASLVFDTSGHLYGTTYAGGAHNYGTVFELKHQVGGGWSEKVVHSFNNDGTDGQFPYGSLIFDTAGNLYGTTCEGGVYSYGAVFELTPTAGGGWREALLHSFNLNGTDGVCPKVGLIIDTSGDLYGTTYYGGSGACNYNGAGCGTVFEIAP